MTEELLAFMRTLAPDLAEELACRAQVLVAIDELAPVGRRQVASRLHRAERDVRTAVERLREGGFIALEKVGMMPTPRAQEVLPLAREIARHRSGLTDLEAELTALVGVESVIVPGNQDEDERVLQDVGRLAAQKVRTLLQSGATLAVTGGTTMAEVARAMTSASPMNVMVVPAQGGYGRSVETQANTLAAEIANRLGGHHRLLHLPDHMDEAARRELLRLPEVRETMERIQRADVIVHGIGCAEETMAGSDLPPHVIRKLTLQGAVGESFGAYYDGDGACLLASSSVGVDLARLRPDCAMVAVAAGAHKAAAIISVLKHDRQSLLITDEGAARAMLLRPRK